MVIYTYILKSLAYGNYYYGSTANLQKRLSEHNLGKVRYTKGRRPWVLHYYEEFTSREDAVQRERFFKSIDGYVFLKGKGII